MNKLLDIINTNTEELEAIKIRFEYVGEKTSENVGEKSRIDRMIDDCDDKHKYYVNKGITISSPITLVDMYNFTGNTNKKYEVYYNQLANKIMKHAKNKILDINKIIVFLQMVYKMPVNGSFDVLHNVCKTNIYYVFEGLGTSMYDWDYASATDEHIQDIINKMNAYYKN